MNERPSDHREPARNEDPKVMAGAIGSATGAGAAAGLGLLILGPVGAVLGGLAGALGGWWAGQGVEHAAKETDREDLRFRENHEQAGGARRYEEVRHGYQLGYIAGRNPGYTGSTFDDAEADLRGAWVQAHLHHENPVPWEEVRTCAEAGFGIARASKDTRQAPSSESTPAHS